MDARILFRRRIITLMAVTLLGVIATCTSCASAPKGYSDGHLAANRMHGWAAFANWGCGNDEPVIFYRDFLVDALLDSGNRADIMVSRAHERSHTDLAQSFPSCQEWDRWRLIPRNRRILEALAHCAEVEARVEMGGDRSYWFGALASKFRSRLEWRADMTIDQARTIMGLYCEAGP